MFIFKIVQKESNKVVAGFSDETEEDLRRILFDQGYFIFLIREANEEELKLIKNLNNNIQNDDTSN